MMTTRLFHHSGFLFATGRAFSSMRLNGPPGPAVPHLELQLITLPLEIETVFPGVLLKSSARFLYCRSELLKQIRFHPLTVLLSNPGTGKSMFQWYYLARLLNPDAFKDALTVNSIDLPEVVIRGNILHQRESSPDS
eukprot:gene36288-48862_t